MRKIKHLVLLFTLVLAPGALAQSVPVMDVVLDLHYTLLYPVRAGVVPDGIVIRDNAGKTDFRLTEDAPQFLTALSRMPGVRVSFYSGYQTPAEFHDILSQIPTADGRNALDLAGGRFMSSDKKKKDLAKIAPDLKWTVLVDDRAMSSVTGQEKNLLWLQKTYDYVGNYDRWERRAPPHAMKYLPQGWSQWFLERHKLARALGLLDTAMTISRLSARPVADVLWGLQHDNKGRVIPAFSRSQLPFYRRGWDLMGIRIPTSETCRLDLELL